MSLCRKYNDIYKDRILQLSRPKDYKTLPVTAPWYLRWGDQEPIRPLSHSALTAVPTERVCYLATPKKDLSACEEQWRQRKQSFSPRKDLKPPTRAARYEHLARLSAPRTRPQDFQEDGVSWCQWDWARFQSTGAAELSLRLLQLAKPKVMHLDFKGDRESAETYISCTARRAQTSPRLEQLALPKMRKTNMFFELGRPEETIRPISESAIRAKATPRIKSLAAPKDVGRDCMPMQDPVWDFLHGK
ncbi:sperm microtubule associated protein 2-like isoform X2 [Paramormyrops kingsleyae]|uniref:sperm microtubule associated protein 2-like isoform X2 n=1 Tax=Paramormyrops kingsleyae TaxID=1676925 RepID=UPI000CD5D83D|nr:testicular haploid expressed gene protein-like isoform X2 [Paramormyrops kingsleyae]